MEQAELMGMSQAELVSFVETMGEPGYRGRQIFAALQHRRLRSFDEMTDLPIVNTDGRIALSFRRWHSPLLDENAGRFPGRNSLHSRRTPRHDLLLIPVGLPVAMHLLSDGPTRFVAFINSR